MADLEKQYNPEGIEEKWLARWNEEGTFKAEDTSGKPPYSIVIPPPNVTGVLHIGHALNHTIQDILIRYKRMNGYNALWMPGTDHAGIATQNVVERALMEKGTKRQDLGREEFINRVWEWKGEYGQRIVNQLKRLGASCDWDRERFTMDEGLSRAVREVFVTLYEEGLIYQGEYMINWCPRCHTALSDLEVEHHEKAGHLWHIRYPVDGTDREFIIATTRPETLLGDTAVAVNPNDDRYKDLIGQSVILPIKNFKIPIIADEYVDMEFGTGALKITPAHDPNDFEIGKKHNLPIIKVIGDDGHMTKDAGAPYTGEDRFKARKMIVDELKEQGLLANIEDHAHAVGQCYRCHNIVEPNISKQWFVRIAPLAKPAIEAVEKGDVKFVPKSWENLYFDWMHNIRDWCISRQIWWGHRIPAWTCKKCGEVMVLRDDPEKCIKCGHTGLSQDPDVLDTWFSSALWPFSTAGWPDKTDALKTFYPTSTLVTSFDIIFFWVARMIMMGLKFTGEVPFREVYIHALVRDSEGQKMSKSKGNTIDPLEIVGKFGADSMRMTLTALAAQGRDIKLSEERIEGYRHFVNKLWNASRFTLMNLEGFDTSQTNINRDDLALADKWILSRLQKTIANVREALDNYKFNEAASQIYQFTWGEFCDWYLELVKLRLKGDEEGGTAARHTLSHVLGAILRMLHPVMPFVTEELWEKLMPKAGIIAIAPYPAPDESLISDNIESEIAVVMDATVAIRNIRGELSIKPSTELNAIFRASNAQTGTTLKRQAPFINRLANAKTKLADESFKKDDDMAVSVVAGVEVFVPLGGLAGSDERRQKAEKELAKIEKEIKFFEKKLSNKKFVEKAPAEVVKSDRAKLAEFIEQAKKLKAHF